MNEIHQHIDDFSDLYIHELLSEEQRREFRNHCQHCESCQAVFEKAQKRLETLKNLPIEEVPKPFLKKSILVAKKLPSDRIELSRWDRIEIAYWSVYAAASVLLLLVCFFFQWSRPNPFDLVVYSQSQLTIGSQASLRVVLVDRNRKTPLADAPVRISLVSENEETKLLTSFVTDSSGTGTPAFEIPNWEEGSYNLRITARTPQGNEELVRTVQLKKDWKIMLSADKPVYQPGQTIRVRSLALRSFDSKPVAGNPTVFRIVDPKGNVILKEEKVSSRFGITSIECQLANEMIEGNYHIHCEVGSSTSVKTVEIKSYALPKFKVDLDFSKSFAIAGEQVAGEISGEYFFGKPVSNGKVSVRISNTKGGQSSLLDELSLKLNEAGNTSFQWRVPKDLFVADPQESGLQFEVLVTDQAEQRHQIRKIFPVGNTPIQIELLSQSEKLVPGIHNEFHVLTRYPGGAPAQTRLTIDCAGSFETKVFQSNELGVATFSFTPNELRRFKDLDVKLNVQAVDLRGVSSAKEFELSKSFHRFEFLMQVNKVVLNGGETAQFTCIGKSDGPIFFDVVKNSQTVLTRCIEMENGRADLSIDLPPELSGTLQICAYRESASGKIVQRNQLVHVQKASNLVVESHLDRNVYSPGDVAKLKVKLTDSAGNAKPGAVSLSIVDQAVFSVQPRFSGLQEAFFETDRELLKPILDIFPWTPLARDVKRKGFEDLERALFAAASNRRTEANRELFDFLEDDLGIDVFEVLNHPEIDELAEQLDLSKGDLDVLRGSNTTHSLSGYTYPKKEREYQKRVEWANTLFKDGVQFGFFFLIVGLFVSLAVRKNTLSIVFLSIAIFILIALMLPAVQAAREASRRTQLANNLKMLHFGLDNAKDAGISVDPLTSSAKSPTRLRKWFPETLLWHPELITDDNGIAKIEIPLADSITSWNVAAAAVTVDGTVGGHHASIRVFQPFFVDVNLPAGLTRKDEIAIPIVVSNYSDKDQIVHLQVEEDDWFEFVGQSQLSVNVKKNSVRRAAVMIRAIKVGQHSIIINAKSEGVSDAIKRSLRVTPEGTPIHLVTNGVLDQPIDIPVNLPADAVEQSSKAVLKVYPSTFSQVAEGLESIFKLPSGCFEQTSSTVYPSVLALGYLRKTGRSVPEIEVKATRFINVGYQRLLSFEVPNGGFDWFGYPPASVEATAYGLMEFKDMAAVHHVDINLINRTRRWLLGKQDGNGAWSGRRSIAQTAYVAWAVFENDAQDGAKNTKQYLLDHPAVEIQSPYDLALICNALFAMNASTEAKPYVQRLLSMKQESEDGKKCWWKLPRGSSTLFHGTSLSGNVETTALVVLALIKSKSHSIEVRNSLRWLLAQKGNDGNWYSTQATILALKALLAGTDNPVVAQKDRIIDVEINGQHHLRINIPKDQAEVMKQITIQGFPGNSTISIKERTSSQSRFQFIQTYFVTEQKSDDPPIHFDLDYKKDSRENQLMVDASIRNNTARNMPMLMIELPVPAGFELNTEDLQQLLNRRGIEKFEIAAQKAILYVRELNASSSINFSYRLKANTSVKVTVPRTKAYLYYSPEVSVWSKSAFVEFSIDR